MSEIEEEGGSGKDNGEGNVGKGKSKGETCKKCGKVGKAGEKWIECEVCQGWYHTRCQDLPAALVEWVTKGKDKGIHWFCTGCDEGVVRRLQFEKEMTDRQDKMEREMETIRKEIETFRSSMPKTGNTYASAVTGEKCNEVPGLVNSGGKGGYRDIQIKVSEALEKEKRKCNVMFMGVDEGDDEESGKEVVEKVLKVLGVDSSDMAEYMGRIGKKGTRTGYKRPIKVRLDRVELKKKMLARSGMLKGVEELKNVYVAEDMTWKELEGNRMLRKKLWMYRDQGKLGVRIDAEGRRVVQVREGKVEVLFQIEEC